MKFQIIDRALHVTSETPAEALEVLKHYSLDILANAEKLASGVVSHVCKPGKNNGEWFPVSYTLDAQWLAPYMARLQKLTGFTGHLSDRPGPRYPYSEYTQNLCHTHIVQTARISSESYTATGFIHSADWNGKTAAQRYAGYFTDCIQSGFGETYSEPEYIRMGNGWMQENPNYLKRHAPKPSAKSVRVFEALLNAWIEDYATPGQREILHQCDANHKTVCKRDSLGAFLLRSYDQGYRVNWGGPLVSFEEFKGA